MAKVARPRRKRLPLSRIKIGCTYDVGDIVKVLDVHRNTVRHWLKQGLATIDDRRPLLVSGATMKAFLQARQRARRRTCRPGEFYCFKRREARGTWGGMADVRPQSDKVIKLTALCVACETEMHRSARRSDLEKWAVLLELNLMAPERLEERLDAVANCDFEKDHCGAETQPSK